jgi:hypothetical protein
LGLWAFREVFYSFSGPGGYLSPTVFSRDNSKYTTFDDEGSSSEKNDDLSSLFANLTIEQKEKINELIKSINEKDGILECQEDLLIKENNKFVRLKDSFALEVEKCKNLTKELKTKMIQFLSSKLKMLV